MEVDVQKVSLSFECDQHGTKQKINVVDLFLCGTPLCEICNEEMEMDDHAIIHKD